jgi:hypothetical protein
VACHCASANEKRRPESVELERSKHANTRNVSRHAGQPAKVDERLEQGFVGWFVVELRFFRCRMAWRGTARPKGNRSKESRPVRAKRHQLALEALSSTILVVHSILESMPASNRDTTRIIPCRGGGRRGRGCRAEARVCAVLGQRRRILEAAIVRSVGSASG